MKDLVKVLKSQSQSEEFDAIKITLASPDNSLLVLRRGEEA